MPEKCAYRQCLYADFTHGDTQKLQPLIGMNGATAERVVRNGVIGRRRDQRSTVQTANGLAVQTHVDLVAARVPCLRRTLTRPPLDFADVALPRVVGRMAKVEVAPNG